MFKVNAYILSRLEIKKNYDEMFNSKIEIPQYLGNEKIFSGIKHPIYTQKKKIIGYWHEGSEKDIHNAINSSLSVHKYWSNISWADRAYIFLKAADLISGPYKSIINAATMICQSKSDTACELISFLRFNVFYANKIFNEQSRLGFVVALTPFNFTYISLPAIMGKVVLWIPSEKQLYYTNVLMEIFKKSGLPDGVINCLNCKTTSNVIHPNFSGVTGSKYKNFILVHPNSNPKEVSKALLYGAFESQINVSRAYIPKDLWKKSIKKKLIENINSMKLGSPRNFSNLITIDKISFLKIKGSIDRAQNENNCNIIIGGKCDSSKGYFITPTVIETINPYYESMIDEGPVLTVYLYEDWKKTISLVKNLKYCFTGYIFCDDRNIISYLTKKFKDYAGNIFINYNQS
ncbi:MAG: aldehyde dehydrogenase family protein [Candidatus Karelsulcia muelleri]